MFKSFLNQHSRIDSRIRVAVGKQNFSRLIVHTAQLPAYRFVDLSHAIAMFTGSRKNVEKIETQQEETLNQLIHDKEPEWTDRTARISSKMAWQSKMGREEFLPIDCFWLCPDLQLEECLVIRLEYDDYQQQSKLQIACCVDQAGEAALNRILELSSSHSIYRNHILHLSYEAGQSEDYSDIEKQQSFRVLFSAVEPVTDEDIVLTDEHVKVLRRNVIDLHRRRGILKANGVPTRRGVLLHGPPGTGKTFACRYLCSQLPEVTRIIVTGSSLINVGAIFSFARLLQPALLILEDVDLAFASREINLYSSSLGDLLDQMDGMRSHEDISVVLTTNSIDRLEAAIKDRPGRISQCIYMGPPKSDLRRRYLEHHLKEYDASALSFDALVKETEGATQAFLKEWVHRSVQFACERLDDETQRVELCNADFSKALDEMRRFLSGSDGHIIGFIRL